MNQPLDKSTKIINKIYDNLSYFDLYGGSLIGLIILTILLLLVNVYTNVMQNIVPIKNNWTEERCKPQNIPFAGIINKPADSTITEFTQDNFNYCSQTILQDVTKTAFLPLTYITGSLTELYVSISNSIQAIRDMVNSIRTNLVTTINNILSKSINITVPLRVITMALSDALGKLTGVLVVKFYMLIGLYDIVKGIFSAIVEAMEILMVPPAIAITILMSLGLGLLAIIPGIFLLIMTVLAGMGIYINVEMNGQTIPSVRAGSCFDKNTELIMVDGSSKSIIDIQPGDKLLNNIIVTEKLILCAKNINMYKLTDGTIISDSHYIKYNNEWILVNDYPYKQIYHYNEPFIYCINTSSKRIIIKNNEYLDWSDIISDDITIYKKQRCYSKNTILSLFNGSCKNIKDIKIGDILSHGEKITGLVESLDESNNLYHLITDKKSFYINNNKVDHYY
jgi:hypothetical protein